MNDKQVSIIITTKNEEKNIVKSVTCELREISGFDENLTILKTGILIEKKNS